MIAKLAELRTSFSVGATEGGGGGRMEGRFWACPPSMAPTHHQVRWPLTRQLPMAWERGAELLAHLFG